MKKTVVYANLISLFLMISWGPLNGQSNDLKGRISISGAFALYPLAVRWAEEFKKLHPKVRIDISAGGAGKGITDVLSKMVDIGMVSRDIFTEELKKGAFSIAVAKDAVIPVISDHNPLLKALLNRGLKKGVAFHIFITGKISTWGQVLATRDNTAIRVYTRSDACGAGETWANYFGKKQEDIEGVGVFGDPGLALAVKKDYQGIGYNNIAYVYDSKTHRPYEGLKIIPLDLNNNGKTDPDENFYDSQDDLMNAIASGKYPSPPARNLYFVTAGKPLNLTTLAFIRWTLTDGQKFVSSTGFISLSKDKLKKELSKIK